MTTHTTDLIERYRPPADQYDELLGDDGVRSHWSDVARTLGELDALELGRRLDRSQRLLVDDGVTYNVAGDGPAASRPWTLDPVPVVIAADEWARIESGLVQRAELLDLVLTDLYGRRELLSSGVLPPEVVFGHPGFLRACDQIRLPFRHQLVHGAFDLGRDVDGSWVVVADRTQAPSGAAYALENRVVVSRVFPDLYRDADVVRLAPFFRELRATLKQLAPEAEGSPNIVVLTPGPWSETSFEHSFLARYLGYPLVQGSDLRVRDGRVWMRTLGRLEPVHVILRRVDAAWCDPLELRPDSHLGVPGLIEACRVGNVSVVNTLGSGVLENPALMSFLPRLAEVLLDQDLLLGSVDTYWCGDASERSFVLEHLHEMVVKPNDPELGTTVLGWRLSAAERDDLRARIEARPHAWVGQDPIPLSSTPTLVDGGLQPRSNVLRTFAVATEAGYVLMPGGLTRVAPDVDEHLITNQRGAWTKDTWILSREPERLTGFWLQPPERIERVQPTLAMSSRAAENLFWLSRYAERAEDLVRQLRVASDRLTEFAPGTNPAGNAAVRVLLEALTTTSGTYPGFVGEGAGDLVARPAAELVALLVDARRPGTVAHSVRRVLDAAGEVRDQLSNDTFLVIGHLGRDLAEVDVTLPLAPLSGPLGRVLQAMLALSGLSSESMVRDDGWQFMEAGRRIERALQLCRLLEATVVVRRDDVTDSLVLESALTSAESIITYRRRYRSVAQVETLLDLLLLDGGNPRSLAFQLDRLLAAVRGMPAPDGGDPATLEALLVELATAVHLADTNEMAVVDPDGRRGQLSAHLANFVGLLSEVAAEIDRLHFAHQLPQRAVVDPRHPSTRAFLGATA
ncbi:MAG: circularly permuted type 2 ATP-grasp protein [Acidimicrobiia bacterium]